MLFIELLICINICVRCFLCSLSSNTPNRWCGLHDKIRRQRNSNSMWMRTFLSYSIPCLCFWYLERCMIPAQNFPPKMKTPPYKFQGNQIWVRQGLYLYQSVLNQCNEKLKPSKLKWRTMEKNQFTVLEAINIKQFNMGLGEHP